MSQKTVWILFLLGLASVGMVAIGLTLMSPKAVPVIKYGNFSTPAELGRFAFTTRQSEFLPHKIWVMGIQPEVPAHLLVAEAFLQAAKQSGIQLQKIYVDQIFVPGPFAALAPVQTVDFKNAVEEIARASQGVSGEVHQVVITHLANSTHILQGNAVHRLEALLKKNVLAFSVAEIGFGADERDRIVVPCLLGGADRGGTGALGCELHQKVQSLAKKFARTQSSSKPYFASMDRWGLSDYLLYLHQP